MKYDIDNFYNTKLTKPKQLIEIDSRKLTTNKSMVIDIFLHTLQLFKYNNPEAEAVDVYDKWFSISYTKFLEVYKGDDTLENKQNYKNLKEIEEFLKVFSVTSISQNNMNFKSMVFFPNININIEKDIVEFKANTEIINAMFNKKKIVGKSNENKAKASYVLIDYKDLHRNRELSFTDIRFYSLILSNEGKIKKHGRFYMEIEELKSIISINSNRNSYVKDVISSSIKNINSKFNTKYAIKFSCGRYGKIVGVDILIPKERELTPNELKLIEIANTPCPNID